MRRRTFPLGVDLGRQRIRVALVERDPDGHAQIVAVATRSTSDDAVARLTEAVDELGTAERRCILGIGLPDAVLRAVSFPAMSPFERRRAARYEAARFGGGDDAGRTVTLTPLPGGWALGVARRTALAWRRATAAAAGLRPIAIDDAALALARVHRDADGVIDIGSDATRVAVFADPLPYVELLPTGGDALTAAIADALGIDATHAEERKRSSGFAGAGEARRDLLIASIVGALRSARSVIESDVRAVALTGNGSRVPGLADALARAAGIAVRVAGLDPALSATIPADVLRAAGPDWSLAVGLALWMAV